VWGGLQIPLSTEGGVWGGAIFCDLEMVNLEVLNLKFFFIVSSLGGVRVDSVANFGFSSNNIRGIFPLTSPATKPQHVTHVHTA